MSFPRYPEYKDSGVEWLGGVPAHWDIFPIKRDLKFLTSGSRGWASHYSDDGAAFIRIGNLTRDHVHLDMTDLQRVSVPEGSEGERTKVKEGDVLFSITAYLGSVAVVPAGLETAYVSQHIALARLFKKKLLPGWVAYVTLSDAGMNYLSSQGYGGTKIQLSLEDVAELLVTAPPLDEQAAITTFLAHETARIDALVEEQKRLIELLKEKRQAVISHAVTKGLDSGVPMKDSGVKWLGEVPAHWEITRVKHIVRTVEQGWSPQCENSPVESESEWGVLKVGCVNHGRFVSQENKKLPADLSPRLGLSIKADDVLISRANTRDLVGSCAVPTVSYPNLMLSDKLFRLRLRETVADPRFLAFFMGTPQARQQIELEATGASSSMLNIGQSTVLEMPFPCPPLEEQEKIRDEIIKETWGLLNMAGEALELKKRLEERRSVLIFAAVTGKIDVRGWQPPTDSTASTEATQTEAV